jgi:hypothetical protein
MTDAFPDLTYSATLVAMMRAGAMQELSRARRIYQWR